MKKWNIYLRAPDAFLDVLENRNNLVKKLSTLVEIKFGTLTGWNKFYCPSPRDPGYPLFSKVDKRYRLPLIRTIKDIDHYVAAVAHCEGELFVCDVAKSKLKGAGTRAYIIWAEKQRNKDGALIFKTGEMKNRSPWYSTRVPVKGNVIFPMFIGNKHFTISNPQRFAITNNLLAGTVIKPSHRKVVASVANSSWFALACELYGRVNLGEGALKIEKTDLDEISVPDFDLFTSNDIATFDAVFKRMAKRQPLPINEEIKQPDRLAIDKIVCRVLGLPETAGEEIRTAVVELCTERESISEMRKERFSERVHRDIGEVRHEIVSQIVPEGFKEFPEDFGASIVKSQKLRVPAGKLKLVVAPRSKHQADMFSGSPVYRVQGEPDYDEEFDDPETVEFVYLAQNGTERIVLAPTREAEKSQMISEYKAYVHALGISLEQAVRERVLDGKLVRGIVRQIMAEAGLISEEFNFRINSKRGAVPIQAVG
jgi:hypothetical protein